jgi:pimeloyl-ACP methyl ester carboxylesterase
MARAIVLALCGVWLAMSAGCNAVAFRHWQQRRSFSRANIVETMVQLPSGAMRVYDGGEGPPLLLLHGFGFGALENWRKQGPIFSRQHRVIAPDMYWFGDSVPRSTVESIAQQTDAVIELLDALHLSRVDVVGASFGGLIAVRLAQAHPERIGKLVLVDAVALRPTGDERIAITEHFHGNRQAEVLLLPGSVDELRAWLATLFHHPSWIPAWALAQILHELLRDQPHKVALCRHMVEEVLDVDAFSHIKVPSLVVWGRFDPLLVTSLGKRLADALHARFVVMEDSGHVPNLEEPARFNRVVLDFLATPVGHTEQANDPLRSGRNLSDRR